MGTISEPFPFCGLPQELRKKVCENMSRDDVKNMAQTCSSLYHTAVSYIYSGCTVRISSRESTHAVDLQRIISGYRVRRMLCKGATAAPAIKYAKEFSPATYVRHLQIDFKREVTEKKARSHTKLRFDRTRVGFRSTETLPAVLGLISNKTFPKLESVTIEVARSSYLMDKDTWCPHWYVAAPLRRLKEVSRLSRINIVSPETQSLETIRRIEETPESSDDHELRDAWDRQNEYLTQNRRLNFRVATFFEVMEGMLTHSLRPALVMPAHDCFWCSNQLRMWYCRRSYTFEDLRTTGPEELAGIDLYQDMLGSLQQVGLRGLEPVVLQVSDTLERKLAEEKGHNLRKRKVANYSALVRQKSAKKAKQI